MKNLKKPARLPRKAPSNQTGGTAWGKKIAAEFSRMMQSADMKKLILLNTNSKKTRDFGDRTYFTGGLREAQ